MDGFEIQSRLFYYVDKNVYGGIKERIEYMFAAFCKVVLRNAAFTAYRDFGRKQKREVSLDYLMSETPFEPFTMDSYFEKYDKPTVFVVQGQEVIVVSERLADALCRLPEQRRVVLLMYFFLGSTILRCGSTKNINWRRAKPRSRF